MTSTADVDAAVRAAAVQDPSIGGRAAEEIAVGCLAVLAEHPQADAAEVARRCVAALPDADASWVAHVAHVVTSGSAGASS